METDASQRNAFIMVVVVILLLLIGSIILLLYNFREMPNLDNEDHNEKYYCLLLQRDIEVCTMEYNPVCGYLNSSINCNESLCSASYSNPCVACSNSSVDYYTLGECK